MEDFKIVIGDTPSGKTLQIVRDPSTGNLYMVQFSSGGEVPEKLRGHWNDVEAIKTKCNYYLEALRAKKKDAKSNSNQAVS